ncbi:hypothetical protein WDU99_06310 [Microbacterium sp. Mu-80]|uniref:Uncharacterized protein n=1 Tax=Microbacterium bandirmense TaxID=3122050 RepID=A0ABU8LC62_9MICO
MSATVYLAGANGPDQPLADAFACALPRYGHRGAIRITRTGDPAAADWFLLLASPESANDPDVDAAIRQRLAAMGVERLQVVVTAGTWEWDNARNAVSAESSAAPEALRHAFPVEPRHMLYAGDRTRRPAPRDPLFLDRVAEIVAPILGTTKDDLAGEDVRRQRRTRTLTRIGAGVLASLLILAGAGGVLAVQGAAAAGQARAEAEQERDDADSRRLAALAQQVAGTDGALARLLAIEAWRISETDQARAALASAAEVSGEWEVTTVSDEVTRLIGHASYPVDLALSDTHVATIDVASALRIWPLGALASPTQVDSVHGLVDIAWSHDGESLAAAGGRVYLFGADGQALGFTGPRAPASVIGAWGGTGFVAGGESIALIDEGRVVAERPVSEVGFSDRAVFVAGNPAGDRILAGSAAGHIALLDADLQPIAQWQLVVAIDQFGDRDSMRALAWDGDDRVALPPDNTGILGPILKQGAPDAQDGAIAGVYHAQTGEAIEPLVSGGYMPLPATSAVFLPDGSAVAITPGGLESPPALGGTSTAPDLTGVPLPLRAELVRTSPDGRWLAVAGDSEEANLLRLGGTENSENSENSENTESAESAESSDPVVRACAAAGRNLTEAEWAIYLPDQDYRATCDELDAP